MEWLRCVSSLGRVVEAGQPEKRLSLEEDAVGMGPALMFGGAIIRCWWCPCPPTGICKRRGGAFPLLHESDLPVEVFGGLVAPFTGVLSIGPAFDDSVPSSLLPGFAKADPSPPKWENDLLNDSKPQFLQLVVKL
jgi:hypothetical protein